MKSCLFFLAFCLALEARETYRVAPAQGGREAGSQVRVTAVSNSGSVDAAGDWDSSGSFQHAWTNMHYGTKLVDVDGLKQVPVGRGKTLDVFVPPENSAIRAIVFGDICLGGPPYCQGTTYNIMGRLPAFLDTIADQIDVIAIIGDNFYDKFGSTTQRFLDKFSAKVQAKLFLTIPGNHDFWQDGSPGSAKSNDQFGYGFMQYYGQDSLWAAQSSSRSNVWDLSRSGYSLPNWKNFFSYTIVGNMGFIQFSGAHSFGEQDTAFTEACEYMVRKQPQMLLLMGHWDHSNHGAALTTPDAFYKLYQGPCSPLQDRFRYVMGHTHHNHPERDGLGFLLGATGFTGANYWGVGLFDTNGGRNTVVNLELGLNGRDRSESVGRCALSKGIASCGTVWQGAPVDPTTQPTSPPGPNNPSEEAPCSKYGWRFYDYYDIFEHNDGEERSAAESRNDCQPLCRKRADCSGYSWADNYCYLKRGSIELSDIERSSDVYSAVLC